MRDTYRRFQIRTRRDGLIIFARERNNAGNSHLFLVRRWRSYRRAYFQTFLLLNLNSIRNWARYATLELSRRVFHRRKPDVERTACRPYHSGHWSINNRRDFPNVRLLIPNVWAGVPGRVAFLIVPVVSKRYIAMVCCTPQYNIVKMIVSKISKNRSSLVYSYLLTVNYVLIIISTNTTRIHKLFQKQEIIHPRANRSILRNTYVIGKIVDAAAKRWITKSGRNIVTFPSVKIQKLYSYEMRTIIYRGVVRETTVVRLLPSSFRDIHAIYHIYIYIYFRGGQMAYYGVWHVRLHLTIDNSTFS